MEFGNHEEHSFNSDLQISKSCENACCRRVAEHASKLIHATAILKSYILQQHQNQTILPSHTHFGGVDPVLHRVCTNYAAMQCQVEEVLSLQREVQQLRKELEFHRETIANYKQLLSDGNSLREELRNELAQVRKSASIARAALDQERRNHVPQLSSQNPSSLDTVSRWFEAYNDENAKLRESIRSLTNKEIELSAVIARVKDYIKEEVSRLIKLKSKKLDTVFSGSWFLGLLGLLGLSCPSELKYKLMAFSVTSSPSSSRQRCSKRSRRNRSVSKSPQKPSSALENILDELDEASVDVSVHTPDKSQLRTHTLSTSSSTSSDFVEASPRTPTRNTKRMRRDCGVSPSPPTQQLPAEDVEGEASPVSSQKSRKLPEIGVCFSLSDQKKSRKLNERQGSLRISGSILNSDIKSCEQLQPTFEDTNPSQTSTVDLDETEALPEIENHPLKESEFSSPVLRPSSPDKPLENTDAEFELEKENSVEKSVEEVDLPRKAPLKKKLRRRKPVSPPNCPPTNRVRTCSSVATKRKRKPFSLPNSLAEIITAKFSKEIFSWFNDITTYKVVQTTSSKPQAQVVEPKPVSPSPEKANKKEDTPRKLSIPLGSCVGMESGIVSTPQPQSLLEDLTAHFAGQRAFNHPSTSDISMNLVYEALIQALGTVSGVESGPTLHPPDPVLRAASLLRAI
ncbi:unnamed protein product, partial [Hydatigera taeniaeformis]|uniref:CAP-Gly domain-containing protein n=1 Tax=Hydatigena taeniaeformis TaxID=6205 RepID=A0A0R3WRR1_HYDTA